jgi:hypothetical protein
MTLPENDKDAAPLSPPEKKPKEEGPEKNNAGISFVCAWCGKTWGPPLLDPSRRMSHGICLACSCRIAAGLF